MALYDFYCHKCDQIFEHVESIKTYDGRGQCPTCKNVSQERIFSAKVEFIGTKVEEREFNPGLGIVTKGKKHRADEARARGLVEVGNDSYAKNHEAVEKERKERMRKRWDEV